MKQMNKLFVTALMLAVFSAGAWAQTQVASNAGPATGSATPAAAPTAPPAPAATPAPAPAPDPAITTEIQALKDAISAQKDALAAQQQRIQALEDQLQRAQTTATEAARPEAAQPAHPTQLAEFSTSASPAGPVEQATPASSGQDQEVYNKDMEGPLTIHFRGIHITPGGFAAAEFLRRSRALGADVVTPFNNLTMPGASQNSLPEFFGTARQTRPNVYVASRAGNIDFSAYVSGDFLSSGLTSTATQTNGYTFRIRQAWGQVKLPGGWSVLGGQMWSLVTENKVGIQPSDDTGKTNDARPSTIDGAYSVGFSFARQNGLRLTKNFNDKVAIAFAVENPQATLATPATTSPAAVPGDYLVVQPGASNTNNTTSTYGFNPSPDLGDEIAFDPGFGHYEIFGLAARFQDRVFPCENLATVTSGTPPVTTVVGQLPACTATVTAASPVDAYNSSKSGGGFGANARWTFFDKHIVFGLHGFGGSGIGRYGATQLSDVTINYDGTLRLIKNLQGLATLEWRGKKLDVYSYVGSEYAGRTYSYDPLQSITTSTPVYVGYGAPQFNNSGCYTETGPATGQAGALSHCTSQTRDVTEGTLGFWYRFHNGPRGRYQWGMQYSYLNRATWSGTDGGKNIPGLEPHGLDSMIFTSFRYYLP